MTQKNDLRRILNARFGFDQFKTGQAEILEALIAGKNTLAVLPTGGGKSLIYQMMGAIRPGLVIIVSPLLSLMQDQVVRLNYAGEQQVIAFNSNLSHAERHYVLSNLARYHYLFISPEMLGEATVLRALQKVMINLLVVDEAHTIVSWGPDFRPEYLNLPKIHQSLKQPQLLLLTATATVEMQKEMLQPFHLSKATLFHYQQSVNRENIYLRTEHVPDEAAKQARLLALVKALQGPGIIYFSSRRMATKMAHWLAQMTGLTVMSYHAGLDQHDRYRIQHQFMQGQVDVITATSAFGMGIDKGDIRYVIHYHLSTDLTAYLQEFGRAGRDGKVAVAILLYATGDESLAYAMLAATIPSTQVLSHWINHQHTNEMLSQQQHELLAFYQKQGQSDQQIATILEQRRQSRQADINEMATYAQLSTGLRRFILTHYEDVPGEVLQFESSDGDWQPAMIGLAQTEVKHQIDKKNRGWQLQMNQLFNIK
ncbi:ATP-dependent DNA helicase RecQ [Weissella diestrammenae]|uniref:ATP-dependent DNA helicase RecQ n=1 Tax=Weissella diestrammenae TaxID=1162633 RepID=A0A7G9T5Q3_9LACO|nr:RecQ family ATP-dependent DNA helicase [Weissella diestrammenae]MCM0582254.1 ATP-dependent DNA helicase RecQ [Weissella diestrammenae]QNN75428.1 ATP-dependent DNA helicase RecQ [Weissella diestrammenae]